MEDTKIKKVETIKMVENAMNVLDIFRMLESPIGVNAISKQCKLNPSTAHRILKSLEKTGWVYQCGDGQYISGPKLGFVTSKNNFYIALRDSAKFLMEQCTAEHGMAMNLIVRNGADCEVIEQATPNRIINFVPPLHALLPYYACGGGKILLSELPENIVDQLLTAFPPKAITPYTIVEPPKYKEELRKVKAQGFAIDFQESSENGSCIAVPIRDNENVIIASLSFSGLIGVKDPSALLQYVPILQATSKGITKNLYDSMDS